MYLVSYLSILIIINPITNINGNKNIPINNNPTAKIPQYKKLFKPGI